MPIVPKEKGKVLTIAALLAMRTIQWVISKYLRQVPSGFIMPVDGFNRNALPKVLTGCR